MGKGHQGDGNDHWLTMRPELFAAVGRGCRAQLQCAINPTVAIRRDESAPYNHGVGHRDSSVSNEAEG